MFFFFFFFLFCYPAVFFSTAMMTSSLNAGAVVKENIWGGAMQKSGRPFLFVSLKIQAILLNEPLRPPKLPPPLYNCLQVLLLHTAAVTNIWGRGKAQVWGVIAPAPRKTASDQQNGIIARVLTVSGKKYLSCNWSSAKSTVVSTLTGTCTEDDMLYDAPTLIHLRSTPSELDDTTSTLHRPHTHLQYFR